MGFVILIVGLLVYVIATFADAATKHAADCPYCHGPLKPYLTHCYHCGKRVYGDNAPGAIRNKPRWSDPADYTPTEKPVFKPVAKETPAEPPPLPRATPIYPTYPDEPMPEFKPAPYPTAKRIRAKPLKDPEKWT